MYKFGEIYLVRFHPSSKSELKKYRPAVICSPKVNQIDERFTLIAPLTTKLKRKPSTFDLVIEENTALNQKSFLLSWYQWTIDTRRVGEKLGELTKPQKQNLKKTLTKLFG